MKKITNEELKNEEAAEKLSEESTDLAAELAADDDKELEEAKSDALESMEEAAESSQAVADLINDITASDSDSSSDEIPEGFRMATAQELKAIDDFNKLFGDSANPLDIIVDLANRVRELEKKVF